MEQPKIDVSKSSMYADKTRKRRDWFGTLGFPIAAIIAVVFLVFAIALLYTAATDTRDHDKELIDRLNRAVEESKRDSR